MTALGNPRPPTHFHEYYRESFDFPTAAAATAGAAASCTITCDANTGLADGDTITLSDGIRLVTYEYDKSSNGVAAGHVAWAVGTTADTVALNLQTAINANQVGLTTSDNGSGVLTVTNKLLGTVGNSTLNAKSSSSGVLAITQFAGGANPTVTIGSTETVKLEKVKGRTIAVERVMLNLPAGLAANASNFVVYELLKNGATVVASWSTHTTPSGQGTITADSPVEMVLSATAANLALTDGDVLSFSAAVTGTVSVPAGRVVVKGHVI